MPNINAKVEFEVKVNPDWIDLLINHNDMFMTNYCGYWLSGMERDRNGGGWLVHEHSDTDDSAYEAAKLPEYPAIVQAWKKNQPLPDGWFRLNEAAAIKAYVEGVKQYGVDWFEFGDADSYDIVIQLALLGEVRYG